MLSSLTFASQIPETRSPIGLPRLVITCRNSVINPFNIINNGSNVFIVSAAGNLTVAGTAGITGILTVSAQQINFGTGGSAPAILQYDGVGQLTVDFGSTANQVISIDAGASQKALKFRSDGTISWNSAASIPASGTLGDTILTRKAAATLQLGNADAASPVAQTLGVQSVVTGTSNTAGVDWTFKASAGTGTAAGGRILFQVTPASTTGSTPNSYVTAVTIDSTKLVTLSGSLSLITAYFAAQTNNAPGGTTQSVDWSQSNVQILDLSGASGAVAVTFSVNPSGPCNITLKVKQGGTARNISSWTVTNGGGSVKWDNGTGQPAWGSDTSLTRIVGFYFDGTNYYAAPSSTYA